MTIIKGLLSLFSSFFSSFLLLCIIGIIIPITIILLSVDNELYVFAHLNETRIQELVDHSDGIKIQFTYEPEKPIIDTFTKFYFSVQDLEWNHIKDFKASVTVPNGQRLFKFQNITETEGDFFVEYIFPDDETHQVITRIDTKTSIIPASFCVFVPHQSSPSLLNPFPNTPGQQNENEQWINIIITIVISIAVLILTIIIIKRK